MISISEETSMSRRRREIQKRKQLQEQTDQLEEQSNASAAEQEDIVVEADEPDLPDSFVSGPGEPEFDDGDIVAPSPRAPKVSQKKSRKSKAEKPVAEKRPDEASWLGQNKENLLLGMLVLYVFLLGLGTVGELFEIEWILNLPLFR